MPAIRSQQARQQGRAAYRQPSATDTVSRHPAGIGTCEDENCDAAAVVRIIRPNGQAKRWCSDCCPERHRLAHSRGTARATAKPDWWAAAVNKLHDQPGGPSTGDRWAADVAHLPTDQPKPDNGWTPPAWAR